MPVVAQFVVLSCLCALAITVALFWSPRRDAIAARALELADDGDPMPREALLQRSFVERGVAPVVKAFADAARTFTPANRRAAIQREFTQAGIRHRHAVEFFLAVKAAALAAGLLLAWPAATGSGGVGVLLGAVTAAGGFVGPDLWLRGKAEARKAQLVRSLPQALDLITSCVEAGLGFDAAIQQILPALGPSDAELKSELTRFLADVSMGQSRFEALTDLAERCGIDEMKGLVAAILQSDMLGQGIGTCLRAQSLHLRTRRRQRAQEESMKAPVKMLIPLVTCIFPALFVVILGPAAIRIVDTLKLGGG
ncbi:MAG: type II secretion system F family protein [Candidatus Sericytochromatia bacterium]|nr:type II secretion system F family protein [Candidatus Tanganyikabacteria bacterium]